MTMPQPGDRPEQTIDNVGAPLDFVQIKLVDPKTSRVVKLGEQGKNLQIWNHGHSINIGLKLISIATQENSGRAVTT